LLVQEATSFMLARARIDHRSTLGGPARRRAAPPNPWAAIAAVLCISAMTARVAAQEQGAAEGFALGRFHPAPAGDRMFGVQSPGTAGDLAVHAMLLADYAESPLVLRTAQGNEDAGTVVGSQLLLHLSASLSLWSRLTVSADLPFAVQGGDGGTAQGVTLPAPGSAGLADLRLGARGTFYGGYFDPFQIALGGYLWLPSGSQSAYAGDGSVRGAPQLIAGGLVGRALWSAAVGPELRAQKEFANVSPGTVMHWGAGFGYLVDEQRRLQVGAELLGGAGINDPQIRTTNLELLLGGRYRISEIIDTGFGVGPGLTAGIGTPEFRAVVMAAYSPEVKPPAQDRDGDRINDPEDACPDVKGVRDADPKKNGCPAAPPPDTDKDGILDAQDACPAEPGVASPAPKKHGCPPPKDTDGDTIVDPEDACPAVAGVADPDPKRNGCPPPDKDGDQVPDKSDACPDIAGVATSDPATNGCPPDTDGDAIRDDQDACPKEKGKPDPDPQKNGCPVAVRVTESEIVILQQVQFDFAKATIRPVSNALLDEVAGVLKDHPEILKLEVQGHADNRGARAYNLKLSQARAESVMNALIQRGIVPDRMQAKGYGPDAAIADNKTEEGRQRNRRVQFQILEKAKKEQQP
jgi:outer membrane protein OmpA-like peptidoglycan-associated protein